MIAGARVSSPDPHHVNDDYRTFIKDIAHKAGLTKKQLKFMDEEITKNNVGQGTAQQEVFNSDLSKLKQEWGLAYEDRVHQAEKVVVGAKVDNVR